MKDICQQIRESAEYINLWLTKQPNVYEESLTHWLLFDVSNRLSNVLYHTFTRTEEGRETGADWEWWILFPQNYVRFRVQAKKVSSGNNYPNIARTNAHGLQINKFLEDSKRVNAISLYALYSPAINYEMCNGKLSNQNDGVFIVGGQQIYNNFIDGRTLKITASDILKLSKPFSCFACCPLITSDGGGLRQYIKKFFQLEMTSGSPDSNNFRGLHDELPQYLLSFLETARTGLPEWWENEYHELRDFKELLVYDFRNLNSTSNEIPF